MGHVEPYAGGRAIQVDVVRYSTPAIAAERALGFAELPGKCEYHFPG
jgi:hypothetical protein